MRKISISHSEIGTYTCPMKHAIKYGLGVKRIDRKKHLEVGDFFHQSVSVFWKNVKGPLMHADSIVEPLIEAGKFIDLVMEKSLENIDMMYAPINSRNRDSFDPISMSESDIIEAHKLIVSMINSYAQSCIGRAPYFYKTRYIEDKMSIPLCSVGNTPVDYQFTIDRVVERNSKYLIVEEKSTGQTFFEFLRNVKFSPQRARYAAALEIATGVEVSGTILSCTRKVVKCNPSDFEFNEVGGFSIPVKRPLPEGANLGAFEAACRMRENMLYGEEYNYIKEKLSSRDSSDAHMMWEFEISKKEKEIAIHEIINAARKIIPERIAISSFAKENASSPPGELVKRFLDGPGMAVWRNQDVCPMYGGCDMKDIETSNKFELQRYERQWQR